MLTIVLPFSIDALQDAMRRYLARPTLAVSEVTTERVGGGVSGSPIYRIKVSYCSQDATLPSESVLNLVLKRGVQHTGAILAGSARREASFYRTLASHMPVRTPRLLLTADDVVGEPTTPLVVNASQSVAYHWDSTMQDTDWVLLEALPQDKVWPRAHWTARHYRLALDALAAVHATWWDRPPDPADYPWVWTPMGHHTDGLVREAYAALLNIEKAEWGGKFLPPKQLRAWLNVLDDPTSLLETLGMMPQTLIHGDYWPGNIAMRTDGPAVFDWQFVGVGPAAYDLSCFYSSSRWWFGRLPLSLSDMRNHYLTRLNSRLDTPVERAIFDMGMDAARAWRFAILWPTVIIEHHSGLLANLHHMRVTAIDPAYASLRRCLA